jgi:ABC-2 type transport system ATP-binding protein
VLELEGLTRRYGDVVALDDLSFSVGEGQVFGFVGPNGAGKTTAMRIVLGVLEPDAGEVRWRGRPVDADTRRRFGYMPEERGLYPKMRVRDQLEYFARLHGLAADAARDSAGYWIERLGVEGRAGDRVEQLSLGNQQRVQLAAALVHDPEVLVLDEPFSGLDPLGVDVLAEVLADRAASGTPWAGGLSGVTVLDKRDGQVVVELDEGTDEQLVLDAARAAGRVTSFSAVEPGLADLFRQAVQE